MLRHPKIASSTLAEDTAFLHLLRVDSCSEGLEEV